VNVGHTNKHTYRHTDTSTDHWL